MKKVWLICLGILILIGLIVFLKNSNSKIVSLSLNEAYYLDNNTYLIFIKHTPECLNENEDCNDIGIFDILNEDSNGNIQSLSNGTFYLRKGESKTAKNMKVSLVNITGAGINVKAHIKIN